jgi:hypothetical protein
MQWSDKVQLMPVAGRDKVLEEKVDAPKNESARWQFSQEKNTPSSCPPVMTGVFYFLDHTY